MPTSDPTPLVSTAWLAEHVNAPDVRILDGSTYLPGTGKDGREEYDKAHIPGARFFDIDEIADAESPLPHMLPPVEKFVSSVQALGIGDGHRVVVYDQQGIYSAPGSGGCSGCSAIRTSPCSTVACQNGSPRAAR